MKKIITVLMIALLLTAFAIPQDKQETPVPTKYAVEKAELVEGYKQLIKQKAAIDERLTSIAFALKYLQDREAAEKAEAKVEPEEKK